MFMREKHPAFVCASFGDDDTSDHYTTLSSRTLSARPLVYVLNIAQTALSHVHVPSDPAAPHGQLEPALASSDFTLPRPATRAEFDALLQGANHLQQQTCSFTTAGSCTFPFTNEENLCFAAGFAMSVSGRTVMLTSKRTTGLPAHFQCPVGIFQYPYQTGAVCPPLYVSLCV
jgi:hypothetical protein